MTSRFASHCLRLGLSKPPATRAELQAAYHRAALKHHPDRGGCAVEFQAVTDSYNALLQASAAGVDASSSFSQYGYRGYTPASMRSHGRGSSHGHEDYSAMRDIAAAVVFPCAIGLAVGLRLLYFRPERDHLRAGGPSRFRAPPSDEDITIETCARVGKRSRPEPPAPQ